MIIGKYKFYFAGILLFFFCAVCFAQEKLLEASEISDLNTSQKQNMQGPDIIDGAKMPAENQEGKKAPVKPDLIIIDTRWAWGEVMSKEAGRLKLNYYDYEAEKEKEVFISVDEETKLENVENFEDIKINDVVSVDFIVTKGNINIARFITVNNLSRDWNSGQ
ncbi:MAG: hypothetical protein COV72_09350 [Candidatus Omnitrophica bacterium CG11_big_fil_rev_8_21_14_0_20_42_13]|uniref:DUF5666 domain-containing protein n=1 Tax=Candidatus Ghiorseimicrobium undicola TaxID=1974746 RepID=A0A2H0LUZ3_9BACT|nr:MAG: hypothetical protein COV72_09350 [Candidatus Omnitrophica bacterium CG11_big_fil_rev_8_21_14_0_20_42_13]